MDKTTPLKFLPGYLCATFRHRTVTIYCYWKGGPGCTNLFFYLEDPDDPGIPENEYRDLTSLEFDCVVKDHDEAKSLAEKVWGRYKEKILSADVSRLYVVRDELVE